MYGGDVRRCNEGAGGCGIAEVGCRGGGGYRKDSRRSVPDDAAGPSGCGSDARRHASPPAPSPSSFSPLYLRAGPFSTSPPHSLSHTHTHPGSIPPPPPGSGAALKAASPRSAQRGPAERRAPCAHLRPPRPPRAAQPPRRPPPSASWP